MNTPKMLPFSGISHEPEWEAECEEIDTELDPGHVCKRCEGRGYVYDSPRSYDGDVTKEDCPDCEGRGVSMSALPVTMAASSPAGVR